GYRQANAKLAALDRHAVNLRKNQAHTLTTTLARRYGTVVLEDLAWIHVRREALTIRVEVRDLHR
ncbi:MAG TPA: hypothetical protein VFD04_19180, partial [Actinomycetes bacterium]|nr:hypothetical protein [Actinomycetes bacterium]